MKQFSRVSKAVLLLLALALTAVAAGPTITIIPFTPIVIPAAGGCGTFDVYLAPELGRPTGLRLILFANSAITQGPVFVTATNLSSGKAINLNISGPTMASFTNNIGVFEGPTIIFGFPANVLPPSLPPVSVATGRTVIQLDASGNIISMSFTGTAQDLCQLLQ